MNFEIIVKTFERPRLLAALLRSLETHYPEIIVHVVDDSRRPMQSRGNFRVIECLFDVGLKAGRQLGLGNVTTEWFVLMDDDFVVTEHTDLRKLIGIGEAHKLSFVGGDVVDGADYDKGRRCFGGLFEQTGTHLNVKAVEPGQPEPIMTHLMANFYAAKTNDVRRIGGYDPRLKIWGHEDIFLRAWKARLTCGFCPSVTIEHWPDTPEFYNTYRNGRIFDFWPKIAWEKYGIKTCNNWPPIPESSL